MNMPDCKHERIRNIEDWPTNDSIQVCRDCGRSRSVWGYGESQWFMVDLVEARKRAEEDLRELPY